MIVSAILLVNGNYALQLRDDKAKECPNMYGLFGGTVEKNETYQGALRREIFEELELLMGRLEHVLTIGDSLFYSTDVSRQWKTHRLHEGKAAEVFAYDELPQNISPYALRAIRTHHARTLPA